jgi:hypothetical protein
MSIAPKYLEESIKWTKDYYGSLKGGTIKEIKVKEEDGEIWTTLVIELRDGAGTLGSFQCELSMDEEGNGPGFLFGLPMPQDS